MKSVTQNLNNIRIIRESVDETPIHEIAEEVRKVSQLFLAHAKNSLAAFEYYIRDFLRIVEIIRVITDNCVILDRQIRISSGIPSPSNQQMNGSPEELDPQALRNAIAEIMDRVFELNLLHDSLDKYHRELSRFLKRYQQFYKREKKARPYVRVIKKSKKINHTLQLFRLTVTTGLKSLKTGVHPESLLKKELSNENRKKLLESSQYNYRRVTHSVIRYFQAVCTILVPNVRPVVQHAKKVHLKLDKDIARDDSYRFILDVLHQYNPQISRLVKVDMSDPLLPEFRISHDNLRVIGLSQLEVPVYEEKNEWIGLEDEKKKSLPKNKAEEIDQLRKIKGKVTELNRMVSKGRLALKTVEEAKTKNLYQNFLLSIDYIEKVKRLCKSLMEPIDYDIFIDDLYRLKPHTTEIPDVLRAIGELSHDVHQSVNTGTSKNLILKQHVIDSGYQHQLGEQLYHNTTPNKLETFVLIFSHFYYKVRMGEEKF